MPWPQATDYTAAIQTPAESFIDPVLAAAAPEMNLMLGLPLSYCGNFAIVFKLVGADGEAWAVKCFIREVTDHQQRYARISQHLEKLRKRFAVQFDYQAVGIRIGEAAYPILKMRWVEGHTLNEFLRDHAGHAGTVGQLSHLWLRLAGSMREANLAHGDLQHGNVLLVPGKNAGAMVLRLVDYDGMWVPELDGTPPGERGHAHYQHPERLKAGGYTSEIDRFSHLVIYTGLRALAVGGKALWDRHDNGENLLFREADFARPDRSKLLPELLALPDQNAAALAAHLICASQEPLTQVPLLTDLIGESGVRPLRDEQRVRLATLFPDAPLLKKPTVLPPLPPDWLDPENPPSAAPGGVARRPSSNPDMPPLPGELAPTVPHVTPKTTLKFDPPVAALPVPAQLADPIPANLPLPSQRKGGTGMALFTGIAVALLLASLLGWLGWAYLAGGEAQAVPKLSGPALTVLKAGGEASARVRLSWAGKGPIPDSSLSLSGVPVGVVATIVGTEQVEGHTDHLVRLHAKHAANAHSGSVAAVLTSGGREIARVELPLEVRPFRVRMGELPAITLRPGDTRELTALLFCEGTMPALIPAVAGLPAGVEHVGHQFGPDGRLALSIRAMRAMPGFRTTATLRMLLDGKEVARGTFLLDLVKPDDTLPPRVAKLDLEGPATLAVVRGKSEPVEIRLKRTNLEEPVLIRPETLPAGLVMEAVKAEGDIVRIMVEAGTATDIGKHRVKVLAMRGEERLASLDLEVEVSRAPAVVAVDPPRAKEPLPSRTMRFTTGDGLRLEGTLWPAHEPRKAITVLILPDPRRTVGKDATVSRLAEILQKDGNAVFTFSFRGQGSNRVKGMLLPPNFYQGTLANNALWMTLRKSAKASERTSPPLEKVPAFYLPWLVQDVIAARHMLDMEHDAGTVNTRNLYVIGLGEGAQLAALWMLAEGLRTQDRLGESAMADLRGAAFVGVPTYATPWSSKLPHYATLKALKGVPPLTVVTDGNGTGSGKFLADHIRPKSVVFSKGPSGTLGHALAASEEVQQYLAVSVRNARKGGMQPWGKRGYDDLSFHWNLGLFPQRMKAAKQEVPSLLNLQRLGFGSLSSDRN